MGIYLQCRIKFICQDMWKEHMKDKHRIGFNCEHCDEYCLFEEQLEEHMEEEHMEDEEYIEPSGFQCVECNEFFESVDKVIEHENEGECNQCGKWLGCRTNMEEHKKKEHESKELKIESHRGTQAPCAETLYMKTTSKEELEKRWSELRNKEDWDDDITIANDDHN